MRELEILTAEVAADRLAGPGDAGPHADGPKHAALHTECLNCGATLQGRWCHACGQPSDDHHRSILHLLWEVVEDFTHLDGRLMQTLPPLFIRPGKLARDHFEGRRQRHVPPLRLFLVALLLFMFSLEVRTHAGKAPPPVPAAPGVAAAEKKADAAEAKKPAEAVAGAAKAVAGAAKAGDGAKPAASPGGPAPVADPAAPPLAQAAGQGAARPPATTINLGPHVTVGPKPVKGVASVTFNDGDNNVVIASPDDPGTKQGFDNMAQSNFGRSFAGRWLVEHGRRSLANREYFIATMFEWGHRLAILMLPIFAGMLALCYFYKRNFYVYDHLIVSMHFLSFVFLIWAVAYAVPGAIGGFLFLAATIWTPVNLFMTLRGAYGSSVAGAALKTFGLWVATLSLFLVLMLGVIFVAMGTV